MLDGIRLSGAKLMRFKHNDPADLQELLERQVGKTQRKLILVESVYSMDGDLAPLREIAQLAADHEAMLMVDEAHAVGMYGPNGEGRVREIGLTSSVTFSMGTLSKASRAMAAMSAVPEKIAFISYNTHAPLSIPRHLRLPKWAQHSVH